MMYRLCTTVKAAMSVFQNAGVLRRHIEPVLHTIL